MKVGLSIKPEFAFKIFDGTKKFEFRKSIFKNKKVHTVLVYASSPVQRVIGEFQITQIINQDIHTLWHLTQDF
jgi:predicted transcriptional regulator